MGLLCRKIKKAQIAFFFLSNQNNAISGTKISRFFVKSNGTKNQKSMLCFLTEFFTNDKKYEKNSKTANLLVVFVEECPSINLPEKNQFLVHFTLEKWECRKIFATMRRHISPFLSLTISSMPQFLPKV